MGRADHLSDGSVVLYRSHRLTATSTEDDGFACRIQAPDSDEVLAVLQPFASAGEALVEGQFWVMQILGMKRKDSRPGGKRPGRTPKR